MDNYKAMYCKLFNKMTDIIAEVKRAQIEAESMFIEQVDADADTTSACADQTGDTEY